MDDTGPTIMPLSARLHIPVAIRFESYVIYIDSYKSETIECFDHLLFHFYFFDNWIRAVPNFFLVLLGTELHSELNCRYLVFWLFIRATERIQVPTRYFAYNLKSFRQLFFLFLNILFSNTLIFIIFHKMDSETV